MTKPNGTQLTNSQGSQYTDDQRREAVARYVVLGNAKRVAEQTGIPERTIQDWTNKDWWVQLVAEIRADKADEIDAGIQGVLDNTIGELQRRVSKKKHVKDINIRDLAWTFGVLFDKQRILRALPTSYSASITGKDLLALADKFREVSRATQVAPGATLEHDDDQ